MVYGSQPPSSSSSAFALSYFPSDDSLSSSTNEFNYILVINEAELLLSKFRMRPKVILLLESDFYRLADDSCELNYVRLLADSLKLCDKSSVIDLTICSNFLFYSCKT